MRMRGLGRSEVRVVPLMLGGNVFGWTVDEARSFEILDAFAERGFNFIDTADVYSRWAPGNGGGESEVILGRWMNARGNRERVVLATKVGMDMGDGRVGLSKRYITEAVEESLRRLQTDYIDLYQSHKDDEATPIAETLEAYGRLMEQGKVRMIGASNYKGARLVEAVETAERNGLPAYATLQPEYNLHDRKDYETDLRPVAERFGLGVVPYFSLASGFLTGKYKSLEDTRGKSRGTRVERYFDERGRRILEALDGVAEETGATQASIALAWLLQQPTVLAPIASATSVGQMESLFAAVKLELTGEQVRRLTEASAY